MDVEYYELFCTGCSERENNPWVFMESKNVFVTCELQTDEYVFSSTCKYCGSTILNRRKAF